MFLYRIFLFMFLCMVSTVPTSALHGAELVSFDQEMAQLSGLKKKIRSLKIQNHDFSTSENFLETQTTYQALLHKLIQARESMKPTFPFFSKISAFKKRHQSFSDDMHRLCYAMRNYHSPTDMMNDFDDLFDQNLIFYTPLAYEKDLSCNLLEYALYCGHFSAFTAFWQKNDYKSPLTKRFLVALLQDPIKSRFIDVLKQFSAGQAKLSSLLTYVLKRSLYPEAWILLTTGVNPNALNFERVDFLSQFDGFIIDRTARQNDTVALRLLLQAGAINPLKDYTQDELARLKPMTKKILGLVGSHEVQEPSLEKELAYQVAHIKMEAFRLLGGYSPENSLRMMENERIGQARFCSDSSETEKKLTACHDNERRAYEESVQSYKQSPRNLSGYEKEKFFTLLNALDQAEKSQKEYRNQYSREVRIDLRSVKQTYVCKGTLIGYLQELVQKNKTMLDGQSLLEYAVASQRYELAHAVAAYEDPESKKALFLIAGCPQYNLLIRTCKNNRFINEVSYYPWLGNVRTPLEMALEQQLDNLSVTFVENIRWLLIEKGAVLSPEKRREYLTRVKKLGLRYGSIENRSLLKNILKTVPSLLTKNVV